MSTRKRTSTSYPPPLQFDASRYRRHVDDLPLSDKDKDDELKALWNMMTKLVDVAWNGEGERDSESSHVQGGAPSGQPDRNAPPRASDQVKR